MPSLFSTLTRTILISRAELAQASHAAFDLLDADRDGKLTRAEYHAGFDIFYMATVTSTRPMLNGKVLADRHFRLSFLDSNSDGGIDRREDEVAFDLLDTDEDGLITKVHPPCIRVHNLTYLFLMYLMRTSVSLSPSHVWTLSGERIILLFCLPRVLLPLSCCSDARCFASSLKAI